MRTIIRLCYHAGRRLIDDGDWSDAELRSLLAHSSKENGWDDPLMDEYDRYDEEIKKRCP